MNRRLAHRGPDGDGVYSEVFPNKICHFGHTRLKIIDTADRNQQPFRSECGRYTLIFNGEIYNFPSLRTELSKDFPDLRFRTTGDTEVLLHLLIREREKCLNRLEGMFAFVFMDKEEDYILLARDPFGMKPLFFAENGPFWLASSEIKGILASGLVESKLNPTCIPFYLRYKFAPKPQTFFEGVFELPEGHAIRILHGEKKLFDYRQTFSHVPTFASEKENLYQLNTLIRESVHNHLIADVPVGLFLSGGVDSSLILALLREEGIRNFPVFVMGNRANAGSFGTNDYHFARLAAKKYEADLHEISVESDILRHLPEFVASLDQPIADGAGLLTFLLSQAVSKETKVALSGAGADELFAGYNRHQAFRFYLRHYPSLNTVLPFLRTATHILPSGFDHPARKSFRLIKKFVGTLDKNQEKTFLNFCSSGFPPVEHVFSSEFSLDDALKYDREHYLVSDILMMTDQTSMRHSLEVRMPYLSPALLRFSQQLGAEYLLKYGRKWMLKRILEDKGGKEFCERPKEGFGMPFGKWIREPGQAEWVALLRDTRHPVFEWQNPLEFTNMLNAHLGRKADYSAEITSMMILMIWINGNFTV